MARRSYSEINLHITWHTKGNLPMINEHIEPALFKFLRNKVIKTEGAFFHAIGGIETRVHIAVAVRPTVDIDKWIGQLKGASSHEFKKALQWQAGFGVVSFGTRDLPWVVAYVENQKERHKRGDISERLERIEDPDG
ncbi:MAG: transposase [Pyrinomonadaceae bacterium]